MSLKSKQELIEVVRPRYLKAGKVEKQKILDEFTCTTGYHRKCRHGATATHAIWVLKNGVPKRQRRKRTGYRTIYRGEVEQVLEQIWEVYGRICSKRLRPYLPEAIRVMERCQEIELSETTKELLSLAPPARAGVKISSASIDRCLRPIRLTTQRGVSTTKPGSLLKNLIPILPIPLP
jgi:hypothetical protein